MKSLALHLLAFLALAILPLRAADDAALKTADDERVAATMSGDRARLSAIYSDDLRYTHSSGAVDTKASYIDALTGGKLKYVGWEYQERNFTFPAPGVALMTGRAKVKVGKADGTAEMVLSFLGVWREEKGQWHFLAWQSCKLPDATPAAK
ncbi:MAG TPA: nuclear transport factor 2 family protein [Chthoniobacter sp.]|nr:nuclear transport factor 2 family protein [Chthoniobacter sp.]